MIGQTKKENKFVREFLEYLEIEKNRSALTINNYRFYLTRFFEFAKITDPKEIDLDKVRQFRIHLNRLVVKGKNLKKSTQNYYVIALRSFLKFLAKRDIKTMAPEKIELARAESRSVDFLEGTDLERLLEAPLKAVPASTAKRGEEPEIIKLRDKAILELLFSAGLRVSELANLKTDNLNLDKDEFTVRGKGDKLRVVFLSNQARYALKSYIQARHDMEPWLFISHDKGSAKREKKQDPSTPFGMTKKSAPLTPRSIQRLVEKYSTAAGIAKHVTPHTLRHSYATDLLLNGADIRSVQAMLGHSSITTTQIYTHITNAQLREVHKAFHGRKRK